ncbi:hypothetical protein JCM19297_28 [Nonlabens ulvanivorans]|nr:hypothetical protein JCM19297_28 [Nonlabens ulvanivorans]
MKPSFMYLIELKKPITRERNGFLKKVLSLKSNTHFCIFF